MRSGFAAIVGPTNSGKSSLVNALVGEKVSIVSPRPQTTYHGVRGIFTDEEAQIVFTDTPGLQNYRERVAQLLNRVTERNVSEADAVVWVFDVAEESFLKKFERLKKRVVQTPPEKTILVMNKVDKVAKPSLLPLLQRFHEMGLFRAIIPISALKRDGLKNLVDEVKRILPEGTHFFPVEMKTDRSKQFQVTEWIREQAYHRLYDELPYSLWVELESWEEEETQIKAHATIHVDGKSKKGMVIGKGGAKLKDIGSHAREGLTKKMGKKVSLFLNVHHEPEWQRDRNRLQVYLEL
ncbi:MAG: GTPase Era [Deltaproteobacteria bacterium]|nr:GTPase Era [Deltaproteobacteria bacterium]